MGQRSNATWEQFIGVIFHQDEETSCISFQYLSFLFVELFPSWSLWWFDWKRQRQAFPVGVETGCIVKAFRDEAASVQFIF